MIRHYLAQRCRGGDNPLRVRIIPVGAMFYLQDDDWWRDRYRGKPVCRNPWIVEAFLNGAMGASRRNREAELWENAIRSGRSDMAVVRSLHDGRRCRVAVRILILHEDEGLTPAMNAYPTLPDMTLYRLGRRPHEGDQCRTNRPNRMHKAA